MNTPIIGYLSPEGKFYACSSYNHLNTAINIYNGLDIYKDVHLSENIDYDYTNGIKAEIYLLNTGYLVFRSRDVSYNHFCTRDYGCSISNTDNNAIVNVLTDAQINFIYKCNEDLSWNNESQLASILKITAMDDSIYESIKNNEDNLVLNPILKSYTIRGGYI